MKDSDYIGATVQFEYGVPALSCYLNGKRIKGASKVVDEDIAGGLCLANGGRIFQHEVTKVIKIGTSKLKRDKKNEIGVLSNKT